MKQFVKLSLVVIVCSTLFGQQIPIQSDHSVYSYLYRQSTIGTLPQWVQSRKPLTLDQVLNLLNQVIETSEISNCLLYTSPSPRDATLSRMPSSA